MTRAVLPLEGGSGGATVALHPILCAEGLGSPAWFERASGRGAALKAFGVGVDRLVPVPVVAFLVEHPSAGPVLIDTGFGRAVVESPLRGVGPVNALLFRGGLEMRAEQTVAAQLAEMGRDPRLIVMTHLHFDHAGGLPDFPGATVLVSEREWAAAHRKTAPLAGYVRSHLDDRLDYRLLDFGAGRARAGFERTLDVFGDGSIVLAYTPGHSAGHLSVVLRLREREALVAGDAIYTLATLREGRRPFRTVDDAAFEDSLRQLEAYDRSHPDAIVIPGHDMEAWRQLEPRYE
jgi:N-acyl homoserine lactone hydrolase